MKKTDPRQHPEHQENNEANESTERHGRARRRLLHSMALGGAAVTVKTLPERWTTPILNAAVLPAHAKSSPAPEPEPCEIACAVLEARPPAGGDFDAVNAIGLGTSPIVVNQLADKSFFSFRQITATVNENCPQNEVNLQVNSAVNIGASVNVEGANQNQPIVANVATFNEVTVRIPMPSSNDGGPGQQTFLAGNLQLVFSANGDDCIIDVTFSELEPTPEICLLHGSSVLMADDRCEEIQNLQVGQLVRATDIPGSATSYGVITKLIKNHRREGYYVINGELRITNDHPVLVLADTPAWRRVDELCVGDVIKATNGHTEVRSFVYHHHDVLTVYMETNTGHFIVKGNSGNYVVKSAYATEAQVRAVEKHVDLISA